MDNAPQPEHPGTRSTEPRRAEEKAVAENVTWLATQLNGFIEWAKKVRWIAVVVASTVVTGAAALNGYMSWAGAQRSSPAQEIQKVDLRVDTMDARVDTLSLAILRVDSAVKRMQEASDGKFDLLLRINCRGLEFADLLVQCRAVGANR